MPDFIVCMLDRGAGLLGARVIRARLGRRPFHDPCQAEPADSLGVYHKRIVPELALQIQTTWHQSVSQSQSDAAKSAANAKLTGHAGMILAADLLPAQDAGLKTKHDAKAVKVSPKTKPRPSGSAVMLAPALAGI